MARQKKYDTVLVYLASALLFFALITIFGSEALVATQERRVTDLRHIHERELENGVEISELELEMVFQKSIKSCLPSQGTKKCKQFIPPPANGKEKRQRVGLLSPPGDLSQALQNRIAHLIQQHNKFTEDETPIDLITTTNVPPYGYGKSHGYTKLVRVSPQPLLLQVTDALTASLRPGETHRSIRLQDVQAATRMILRWHCRLSHVAAHTALSSVPLSRFVQDTAGTMQEMQEFLTPHLNALLEKQPQQRREEKVGDDDMGGNEELDDDASGMMSAEYAYGNQILRDINRPDIINVLNTVLQEEIALTKTFTKWPCPSFWDHGAEELSDVTKRLAQALSPNCDDPFAQCFVERDKCEFHGDAECKKKSKR